MNTADDLLRRALECIDWHCPQVTTLREEIRAYLAAPEMKDEPVADEKLEALIDECGGYWVDGEFRVDGKDLMSLLRLVANLQPPTKTAPMKPMTEDILAMSNEYSKISSGSSGTVITPCPIDPFAERHHGITHVRD